MTRDPSEHAGISLRVVSTAESTSKGARPARPIRSCATLIVQGAF